MSFTNESKDGIRTTDHPDGSSRRSVNGVGLYTDE